MEFKNKIIEHNNLLKYGFTQDKEDSNVYYYGGTPYSIIDSFDISEILSIIDEINWKRDNEGNELQNKTTEVKKERTKEYLPTHADILNNTTSKEYKFLSNLISVSNFNERGKGENMEAYLYEKDLDKKLEELKEQGVKIPCKKTIQKHIKKLSSIEIDGNKPVISIESSHNGLIYKIAQSYDNKYYTTIPSEQLKDLIICTNDNMLKLYCIFKYTIEANKNEWTRIDRMYLCRHMGLEENRGNCNTISIAISGLMRLGYIKVEQEDIKEINEEGNVISKTVNYYKLTTFEEWKELIKIKKRTKRNKK